MHICRSPQLWNLYPGSYHAATPSMVRQDLRCHPNREHLFSHPVHIAQCKECDPIWQALSKWAKTRCCQNYLQIRNWVTSLSNLLPWLGMCPSPQKILEDWELYQPTKGTQMRYHHLSCRAKPASSICLLMLFTLLQSLSIAYKWKGFLCECM